MANPAVQEAYRNKVSSERSGPELMKLLAGAKPADALRIMFETGLDKAVFNVPEVRSLKDLRMEQQNKHHAHNLLDHTLLVVENAHKLLMEENAPPEMRIKMLLAALFHDYGKAHPEIASQKEDDPSQMQYLGHEDKSAEIAESIMKSIAIPENDRKFVTKVISLHMLPHRNNDKGWTPKMIGKFLRKTDIPGQDSGDVWRWIMTLGIADTLSKDAANPDVADAERKRALMRQIEEMKSRPGPSLVKPLLDGNELMVMFPAIKPNRLVNGKNFIKDIGERLLDAQAAGTIADKAQAQALVESMRTEIEAAYAKTAAWLRGFCKFAETDYLDIGHKGTGNISWVWDDVDKKIIRRWHAPNEYWPYKGRYDPKKRSISVYSTEHHDIVPEWLQEALEREFGSGNEFIPF